MRTIEKPKVDVKSPLRDHYELTAPQSIVDAAGAQLDFLGHKLYLYRTVVTPRYPGRPLRSSRPYDLKGWLNRLSVLEVEEIGRLGTTIKETKYKHVLGRPHSLLRGPYRNSTALSSLPTSVWMLILDYDLGLRDVDRERLRPYLHIGWTTMGYGPGRGVRVVVPIVPSTDEAGHEALRNWFMHDYRKHHDELSRAAIMPVRRRDRSGRQAELSIWLHVGKLLAPLPAGLVADLAPAAVENVPVPEGGFRVANALRANVVPVCRYLGIELSRVPQVGRAVAIRCPFGGHDDQRPSASVSLPPGGNYDVWVTCFGHEAAPARDGKLCMPIVDLFWIREFKAPKIIRLRPTKAQRPKYGARLLHEAGATDRPTEFPWTAPVEEVIDDVVRRGLCEPVTVEPRSQQGLRFTHAGREHTIVLHTLSRAYLGTNLLFACNHFVHGQHTTALEDKFMAEWCGLGRNGVTYGKARAFFLHVGLIEPVGTTTKAKARPVQMGMTVKARPPKRSRTVLYDPICT